MYNNLPAPLFVDRSNLGMATPEQLINFLGEDNIRGDVLILLKRIIQQANQINKGRKLHGSCLAVVDVVSLHTYTVLAVYAKAELFSSLQEVTAVYSRFSISTFSMAESTRVCNALAVLQCMASHPEARRGLIKANIPFYVDPFLRISTCEKPQEFVRLSSLDLIEALAKFDDPYGPEILNPFLDFQLLNSCLHCMDHGDKLTVKAATLIVMKILMQEAGLNWCCDSPQLVLSVVRVLRRLVEKLSGSPCLQLLKYVIQCYLCLSWKSMLARVYDTVRYNFPPQLSDHTFHICLREDPEILNMLQWVLFNLNLPGYRP